MSVGPATTAPPAAARPNPAAPPSFNPRELTELYLNKRYDDLSDRFLAILGHFNSAQYLTLSRSARYFINSFVENFLHLFTQPDYVLGERHVIPFLRMNVTISNLVAISSTKTTDAYLELLRDQSANFIKILTLYSARNTVTFDRRRFFDTDPGKASIWYCMFAQAYRAGLVRDDVCRRLREHFEFLDDRLTFTFEPQEIYFGSTYLDGESDRHLKPLVNQAIRKLATPHRIRNTPNPKKIAVLSGLWAQNHSVYRNYAQYVRALRDKYHLTFFQLGNAGLTMDESMFDEVRKIGEVSGKIDLAPIADNDFTVAYFPDIGMTPHSILLANMRLAPIQIASPGHSVSTWGADIDYFISGDQVEIPDHPERNYSERLVLLPDCGVIHNQPLYTPTGRTKTIPDFIVNCPWFAQKVNAKFVRLLQRIIDESPKRLRFRVFVGSSLSRQGDFLPFVTDLGNSLRGAAIEVVANRPYNDYMGLMEEGDISIDSFHFGGCNTIADSLFLRKPTVTYDGDKWYSRIGSQMLRSAEFGELVATNDDQYVRIVNRLIRDDSYREEIRRRIVAANLDATIFDARSAPTFRDAVDYLIANHDRLKAEPDRKPLRMREFLSNS